MSDFAACAPAGHRPSIRLIVNADDFGISERINAGIALAHRVGIVTATSLMAVGRAFDQAVGWCHALPSLDVGVHLTLVAERPLLSSRSSLVNRSGRFHKSAGAFLRRFLVGAIRRADVEAEWSAQIERILAQGIRVTHLDSHQHVHILPGLADLCVQLAGRYRIPFVRVPIERLRGDSPPSLHGMYRTLGSLSLRAFWAMARLTGPRARRCRAPHFLGFQDGGRLDHDRLRRLLHSLRPGRSYELMCHPGFMPQEPDVKGWKYQHETELQALIQPSTRGEIAARGIRLCSFAELAFNSSFSRPMVSWR